MAQTLVVLTGGFDLSAGMILTMASCLASVVVNGSPGQIALGVIGVLGEWIGGRGNQRVGCCLRAHPADHCHVGDRSDLLWDCSFAAPKSGRRGERRFQQRFNVRSRRNTHYLPAPGWHPGFCLVAVCNSVVGRSCYAVGSAEGAAYMSGLAIGRSRFAAYSLAGLLAAAGGLALSLISLSGEASASQGGFYTLNSIAAVAIGGTSLFGGSGGMIGSILGAFILRTISDLLFVFDAPALWQPLFQGFILLGAVCLGGLRVLRRKNQMDVFL